jgi:hypothetical protein
MCRQVLECVRDSAAFSNVLLDSAAKEELAIDYLSPPSLAHCDFWRFALDMPCDVM